MTDKVDSPILYVAASSIPAPAPAPSASLAGSTCALEYLVNAGNFNTLIELVEAASDSADISRKHKPSLIPTS